MKQLIVAAFAAVCVLCGAQGALYVSLIGSDNPTTPTILCGDVEQDDVWDTFDFAAYLVATTNGQSYARIATDLPVMVTK